jgi:hypothetical protein
MSSASAQPAAPQTSSGRRRTTSIAAAAVTSTTAPALDINWTHQPTCATDSPSRRCSVGSSTSGRPLANSSTNRPNSASTAARSLTPSTRVIPRSPNSPANHARIMASHTSITVFACVWERLVEHGKEAAVCGLAPVVWRQVSGECVEVTSRASIAPAVRSRAWTIES